jgi:hypothetical protein
MRATTIPVTIHPDAAARAAELGMQRELETMLDYLTHEVGGVLSVEVQLALPHDTGDESGIVLDALLDRPLSDASARRQIRDWKALAFPPEVNRYFTILTLPAPLPGGEALLPKEAMAETGIPITVSAEADQRIAELGMQRELWLMLDHALRTLHGLQAVTVELALPYDTGEEPGITIEAALSPSTAQAADNIAWRDWFLARFPPDIRRYFHLMTHDANGLDSHGR